MRRAIIYCRISRDPGHDELGVRRQEKACRDLCAQHGLEVVGVEIDDDRSAYSGKRRPGYERVLRSLQDREAEVLVAWHPDRITRRNLELEHLIAVVEAASASIVTVQAGIYDLSTPTGRMTARVVGSVAQHESEHKSARLRAKHAQLAEAGAVSGGGTRPFGYDDDRVTLRADEAAVVQRMVRDVLAGVSLRSITRQLNADGWSTSAGREWYPSAVKRVLVSPRIAGLRVHRAGTFTAEWPAIITADDHRRLVAVLGDPSRRTNERARRYLLTGFLRCGRCGQKMVARPVTDGRPAYVCATGVGFVGCGGSKALAEPLEAFVADALLAFTDTAVLHVPTDEPFSTDELVVIEARLTELAELWAAGELDRTSWAAARRPLEHRREELARSLWATVTDTAAARLVPAGKVLRDVWPDLDVERRRAALGLVVEAVVLGPAVRGRNRFDSSRVSIAWKG